jgi:hypothetical protein
MSTAQRNDACLIAVDPSLGEILRHQTLVVLEAHHHYFEDLLDLSPQAQHALSVIYRDAFVVLDALGWSPDPDATTIDVPLTAGHIIQLRRRLQDSSTPTSTASPRATGRPTRTRSPRSTPRSLPTGSRLRG